MVIKYSIARALSQLRMATQGELLVPLLLVVVVLLLPCLKAH